MKLEKSKSILIIIFLLFSSTIFSIDLVKANDPINGTYVFKCGNTSYYDDNTDFGRVSWPGQILVERKYKSLFEGEQIFWKVLVYDSNGINNLDKFPGYEHHPEEDMVYVTAGQENEIGNEIQVVCKPIIENIRLDSCNLGELKTNISNFDSQFMKYYYCVFTTETPESLYGKYWISVEAKDKNGSIGIMKESEQWFLNPRISININDSINFEELRPGKTGYSNEITINNDADLGSGMILDMFISGTDFYDSINSKAKCPDPNKLSLTNFRYYAKNGLFDTTSFNDSDDEGYRDITYSNMFLHLFDDPNSFYNKAEIIPKNNDPILPKYYLANELKPDDKMSLKFKINVPEQCNGEFDSGNIYIWAEAI